MKEKGGLKNKMERGRENGWKEGRKEERTMFLFCAVIFQLAADASNVVAMTEEEKKRLEEILSDMGDLTEEV